MRLLALATVASLALPALAQHSAFTYQGHLTAASGPAQGSFDFQFSLFAVPANGTPLTSPVSAASLPVSNGLFTATLDFGSTPFDGAERWLEIAVRSSTSTNPLVTLSPRQPIGVTPYALRAKAVPDASITAAQLAPGAVTSDAIHSGAIGPAQLAAGAAAQNLLGSGQSPVPAGGMILSTNAAAPGLLAAGYVSLGSVGLGEVWRKCSTAAAPPPRAYHTAVWTGTEMLVWGGMVWDGGARSLNTGGRYNPASDTWAPISTNHAPLPRHNHTVVWTGTEMIVWGGQSGDYPSAMYLNDGGRYSPTEDTWRPLPQASSLEGRYYHTAVWTGSEMIVWGGRSGYYPPYTYFADGARYSPSLDGWIPLSGMDSPNPRSEHTAVWTGTEMLIWGGWAGGVTTSGGRYSLDSGRWQVLAGTNTVPPTFSHSAIWTGREMVVWGGHANPYSNAGGRYDPAAHFGAGGWTSMDDASGTAPAARAWHTALWTGSDMLIWGGSNFYLTGGRHNREENRWFDITGNAAPAGRYGHTAVWTGSQMLVWGGIGNGSNLYLNDCFSYTPSRSLYLYQRP